MHQEITFSLHTPPPTPKRQDWNQRAGNLTPGVVHMFIGLSQTPPKTKVVTCTHFIYINLNAIGEENE